MRKPSRPGRWGDLTKDLLMVVVQLLADADVQARPCHASLICPSYRIP